MIFNYEQSRTHLLASSQVCGNFWFRREVNTNDAGVLREYGSCNAVESGMDPFLENKSRQLV